MRLLFVCLGNICRSPAAEAVMTHLLAEAGADHITCDSAGILDYHAGDPADRRMGHALQSRGYRSRGVSRPVISKDFSQFDLILAMDQQNFRDLQRLAPPDKGERIRMMCDYAGPHKGREVPDPYYGGPEGFDLVIDILEDACRGLLGDIHPGK